MADKPRFRTRLVLEGWKPVKEGEGKQARRYVNTKTGVVISKRKFQEQAKRVQVPYYHRESALERRVRLERYATNRAMSKEGAKPWEYYTNDQIEKMPNFQKHEAWIHSNNPYLREAADAYYDELQEIWDIHDWDESP